MTIEEVFDEYINLEFDSIEDKKRVMANYRKDLLAAGMPEDEVEEELEGWFEVSWTQDDWKEWYGVDTDEELEDAQDSDAYWND